VSKIFGDWNECPETCRNERQIARTPEQVYDEIDRHGQVRKRVVHLTRVQLQRIP